MNACSDLHSQLMDAFVCAGDELFIIYPNPDIPGRKRETNIEEGIVQFGCVLEPRSITVNQKGEHLESIMHAQSTQLPVQIILSCHPNLACMPASLADCASTKVIVSHSYVCLTGSCFVDIHEIPFGALEKHYSLTVEEKGALNNKSYALYDTDPDHPYIINYFLPIKENYGEWVCAL